MRYTIFDTPIVSPLLRGLSLLMLKVFGWRVEGKAPDAPKFVVIAAPHTTNWDLPFALFAAFAFRIKIHYMGKDSLFKWPFGWFMRWLGGIPVERSRSHGKVQQMVKTFEEHDRFALVMAPEGTRSRTDHWRSGFYHIATNAGVPIVLGYLDYRRKAAGVGPIINPTGDIDADMKTMSRFYAGITGKYPEKSSEAIVVSGA